ALFDGRHVRTPPFDDDQFIADETFRSDFSYGILADILARCCLDVHGYFHVLQTFEPDALDGPDFHTGEPHVITRLQSADVIKHRGYRNGFRKAVLLATEHEDARYEDDDPDQHKQPDDYRSLIFVSTHNY